MYDKELISGTSSKGLITERPLKELLASSKEEDTQELMKSNKEEEETVIIERDNSTISPRYKAIYKGRVVLDMIRSVGEFHDGMARVTFVGDRSSGWMNSKGQLVFQNVDYGIISNFRQKVAIAEMNGRLGLVDTNGNVLIPFKCSRIGSCYLQKGYYDYDIYKDSAFNTYCIPYNVKNSHFTNYYCIPLAKDVDFRNGYGILKDGKLFGLFRSDLSEILPYRYKWMVRINETEFLMRKDEHLIYYNAETREYID